MFTETTENILVLQRILFNWITISFRCQYHKSDWLLTSFVSTYAPRGRCVPDFIVIRSKDGQHTTRNSTLELRTLRARPLNPLFTEPNGPSIFNDRAGPKWLTTPQNTYLTYAAGSLSMRVHDFIWHQNLNQLCSETYLIQISYFLWLRTIFYTHFEVFWRRSNCSLTSVLEIQNCFVNFMYSSE